MLTVTANDALLMPADLLEVLARRMVALAGQVVVPAIEAGDPAVQAADWREEETRIAARVPGNPSEFEIIYDRYYARILNYLYRRTMDRDLAEDLTSRTFMQAFDALQRECRQVWVCPWLYRIATNVHVSHLRSLKCLRERIADIGRHWMSFGGRELRPDHAARSREETARVRECLASMPEKYRAALILRYDEELAYREIGEVLGLTPATIRKRIERGLRILEARFRDGAREEGHAR